MDSFSEDAPQITTVWEQALAAPSRAQRTPVAVNKNYWPKGPSNELVVAGIWVLGHLGVQRASAHIEGRSKESIVKRHLKGSSV